MEGRLKVDGRSTEGGESWRGCRVDGSREGRAEVVGVDRKKKSKL